MIDLLQQRAKRTAPTALRPRPRRRPRDDSFRDRRRAVYQARIDQAETPVALLAASIDYLRANLTFVRDPQRAWHIATQVAEVIVRVAGELEQDVTRGGNRERVDQPA